MLARSAMRRMRRLEALLHELSGTATSGLPRRWLFPWKYWCARQAPSKVDAFAAQVSERSEENEIEQAAALTNGLCG